MYGIRRNVDRCVCGIGRDGDRCVCGVRYGTLFAAAADAIIGTGIGAVAVAGTGFGSICVRAAVSYSSSSNNASASRPRSVTSSSSNKSWNAFRRTSTGVVFGVTVLRGWARLRRGVNVNHASSLRAPLGEETERIIVTFHNVLLRKLLYAKQVLCARA